MNRKSIQLAILHDHQSVIDELALLLQEHPHIQVVVTATTPGQLLCQLTCKPVDVVLADDTMLYMNEDELTKRFKELFPRIKIIALLANKQNDIITRMVKEHRIAAAVPRQGEDQAVLIKTLDKIAAPQSKARVATSSELTARELEIIRLIEQEYSNKQIAQSLFISERTVETHRKNIFRKTRTNNVIGLIKYAYEHKLV